MATNPYIEALLENEKFRQMALERTSREQVAGEQVSAHREATAAQEREAQARLGFEKEKQQALQKQQDLQNILSVLGLETSGAIERVPTEATFAMPGPGGPGPAVSVPIPAGAPGTQEVGQLGGPFAALGMQRIRTTTPVERAEQLATAQKRVTEAAFKKHRQDVINFIDSAKTINPRIFDRHPDLMTFLIMEANGLKPPEQMFVPKNFEQIGATWLEQARDDYMRTGDRKTFEKNITMVSKAAQLAGQSRGIPNPVTMQTAAAEHYAGLVRTTIHQRYDVSKLKDDEYNRVVDKEAATHPAVPDGLRNAVAEQLKRGQPAKETKPSGLAGTLDALDRLRKSSEDANKQP